MTIMVICFVQCSSNKNNSTTTERLNENFDEFYKKFTNDSLFQLDRIEFPVHGRYMDNEIAGTVKNDSMTWTKQNWKIIHQIRDEYKNSFKETKTVKDNSAIIKIEGIEYSLIFEQTFTLKNGKWYLTNLTDISI